MNSQTQIQRRTLRNLVLFALVAISSGWIGYALDNALGLGAQEQLGMLLWIVMPLGACLVLRAFAGDGWKDFGLRFHLRANGVWYLVSFAAYPLALLGVLAFGFLFGWITRTDASTNWFALLAQAFALALVPSAFKNILEEFAWRGYVTPKIQTLGWRAYAGHALTGVLWWAWHLPYWLFFMDRALMTRSAPWGVEAFMVLSFVEILALSVVLGELRLLTHSTWAPVVMHTTYNAIASALLLQGGLHIASSAEFFVWYAPGGAPSILILTLLGIALHRARQTIQRRVTAANTPTQLETLANG